MSWPLKCVISTQETGNALFRKANYKDFSLFLISIGATAIANHNTFSRTFKS